MLQVIAASTTGADVCTARAFARVARPSARPYTPGMGTSTGSLERAIAGALRATIQDHGPITAANIGSAVKRIVGNLRNARLGSLAAADMGRRRWAGTTEAERTEAMSAAGSSGGRSAWAKLTPEQRSEEMRRRAAKRRRRAGAGGA